MSKSMLLIFALFAAVSTSSVASAFVLPVPTATSTKARASLAIPRLSVVASDDSSSPGEQSSISRRDAIATSARGAALASILALSPLPAAAAATPPDYGTAKRTIVLTGANSGIGFDAACRLAARDHKIVLVCRTQAKADDAADRIRSELPRSPASVVDYDLVPMECDLASLASVDSFARAIKPVVADSGIDSLCLNAGLARNTEAKECLRTAEGFELTVGTNHLGHMYLNHLLLPLVRKDTGRIVVTASSVHDPDSPGGAQGKKATLGDLSGLASGPDFEMVDGGPFNADKAYKDSKLCNVLFTRELQRRLDASGSNVKVNSFTPGLIVSTGFFRDQNPLFTKVFDVAATNIFKVAETPHWGGGSLEYMALDNARVGKAGGLFYGAPPGSVKYGEAAFGDQFTVSEVSKEAQDNVKAGRLWELSETLLGIRS